MCQMVAKSRRFDSDSTEAALWHRLLCLNHMIEKKLEFLILGKNTIFVVLWFNK